MKQSIYVGETGAARAFVTGLTLSFFLSTHLLMPVEALADGVQSTLSEEKNLPSVLSPSHQSIVASPPLTPKVETTQELLAAQLSEIIRKSEKNKSAQHQIKYTEERAKLKALQAGLKESDQVAISKFSAISDHIKKAHLSSEIEFRNEAALRSFQKERNQFEGRLAALQTADEASFPALAQKLRADLFVEGHKRIHHFDPKHLPFRVANDKVRRPITTQKGLRDYLRSNVKTSYVPLPVQQRIEKISAMELRNVEFPHQSLLYASRPQPVDVATIGPMSGLLAAAAIAPPGSDDLATTEDVQITPAITALAAALGNNTVQIYNWVHDNIEFVPTYGSIQGSDETLQSKHGNDTDIASLLIALLRVSGIPSRYMYGTIDVPAHQVMNWVGGASDPMAALQILGQGGIPCIGLETGGQVVAVQLEHTWVEAFVPIQPSRGVKVGSIGSWTPLDASFKQHVFGAPIVTPSYIGGNISSFSDFVSSGVATGDGYSMTGFNIAILESAFSSVQSSMTSQFLAPPGASQPYSIDDLFGSSAIQPTQGGVLPSGLPYAVQTIGQEESVWPDSLRVVANIQVNVPGGGTLLNYTLPLSSLAFQSLHLGFAPATASDAATWNSYVGDTSFPPYLINANAVLTLNGNAVATSGAVQLATDLQLTVAFSGAGRSESPEFDITAGDELELGIDAAGFALSQGGPENLDRSSLLTAAGNLYALSKVFWLQGDYYTGMLSKPYNVVAAKLPSVGTFSSPLMITYSYGVPFSAFYGPYQIDAKLDHIVAASKNSAQSNNVPYVETIGMFVSALEGYSADQVFVRSYGSSVSAARLLQLANAQNIPITYINAANYSSVSGELQVSSDVQNDIANAINAGLEVIIPQRTLTNAGWSGSGYILRDPATGAADYRIDGGLSGTFVDSCGREVKVVPVIYPQMSEIEALEAAASPLVFDKNGKLNTGGVVLAAVAAVAIFALIAYLAVPAAVTGVAATASTANAAAQAFATAMAVIAAAAFTQPAYAATENDCSCKPVPVPHLGGDPIHNACADFYSRPPFTGFDAFLRGKNFDAYNEGINTLYEIKTENYSGYASFVKKLTIAKEADDFEVENGIASSCKVNFLFGISDSQQLSDLSEALPGSGAKLFLNECQSE